MENAGYIALEAMHHVVAMASDGMHELPHRGAVMTVLAVTGLTHRKSYSDIFIITLIEISTVYRHHA